MDTQPESQPKKKFEFHIVSGTDLKFIEGEIEVLMNEGWVLAGTMGGLARYSEGGFPGALFYCPMMRINSFG